MNSPETGWTQISPEAFLSFGRIILSPLFSNLVDTRAIELLLVKGQMDLQELVEGFAQESHFHRRLDDLLQNDAKPDDFISEFLRKKH